MEPMTTCPACHRDVQDGTQACPFCGVVFSKWKPRPTLTRSASEPRQQIPRSETHAAPPRETNLSPDQTQEAVSTLIRSCTACNGKVSSEAMACPHCGHPFTVEKARNGRLGWLHA